jgi:hypothetical protein
MAARILNKFLPADEGILCESLAHAETKLNDMLKQFKARGFSVSETKDDEGVSYSVFDQGGRPVGIYYVE